MSNKKVIIRNILATFLLQFVTIINGFIVPKIFIGLFGSEANGLVTSINQMLNYITLLEGGVSNVILAALFKPLRDNDEEKISAIFNATSHFFKQMGFIYVGYAVIVAVVYPLVVDVPYSYGYVLVLVLVLASNLFTQYFFSMSYQVLIRASQQVYFISITKAIIIFLNIVAIIAVSKLFPDLIVIKLLSALVLLIQPLIFWLYVKKKFKLNRKVPRDSQALLQRWAGFGHTLAYFINTNASVFILTAFSSLAVVSVYSVYMMVTSAIRNLAVSVASALLPSLGNVMASDDKKASNRAFDIYEVGMWFLTTLLFCCGIVLVVPFVKIYTAGFDDANYIQPVFAVLLMAAEMVYCLRTPYVNAAYAKGHFKQTAKFAYIEVGVNVLLSLILVHKFELVGVAIGLLAGMTFRMIAHVIYLNKNILNRSYGRFFKVSALFLGANVGIILLTKWLLPLEKINGYFGWVINGGITFGVCLLVLLIITLVFFKREMKQIIGKKHKT